MVHWIIFIPTGTVNIKEALDKAIESTPGVALLDGVILQILDTLHLRTAICYN